MRTLTNVELDGVAGGYLECDPDGCRPGPPGEWESITLTGFWARYWIGYGATVDTSPWEYIPFGSGGGAGEGDGGTDDNGLEPEQWVALWTDIFKKMTEEERSRIGNAMVAVGATQLQNPFTTSAGQFLTFLGAAIVKGDVDSAAFYCDQLERTYLNKSSKDAILDALGSFGEVAKVFKERFVKKR